VHEGEQVKAGQPLVEISANLVSASMGDTHAVISAQLRAQQAQVRTTLANLKSQMRRTGTIGNFCGRRCGVQRVHESG
jgi:multidrug efflux pump subunit AcrA (membrane-fusion protein)